MRSTMQNEEQFEEFEKAIDNPKKVLNNMEEKKYNIKLDLKKLKNTFVKDIQGSTRTVQCLCIPIKDNRLFVSERGSIYLDLQATPLQQPKYGQSHLIKPKVGSDNWKAMSEEERKAIPIVGSLSPIEYVSDEDKNKNAQDVYNPSNNKNGYVSNNYGTNTEDDGMPF